jgi:hypothetical protein
VSDSPKKYADVWTVGGLIVGAILSMAMDVLSNGNDAQNAILGAVLGGAIAWMAGTIFDRSEEEAASRARRTVEEVSATANPTPTARDQAEKSSGWAGGFFIVGAILGGIAGANSVDAPVEMAVLGSIINGVIFWIIGVQIDKRRHK